MIKKLTIICVAVLVVAGCGGMKSAKRSVQYPNPETAEAKNLFAEAYGAYTSGDFDDANGKFAKVASGFPYTELTDKSNFYRGEIAFSKGGYEGAIALYKQAFSQIESPNVAPMARFKAALAMQKLGRSSEAFAMIEKIDRSDASALLRLRVDSLGVISGKAAGRTFPEYSKYSLFLLDDYAEGAGAKASSVNPGELVSEDQALADARKFVADPSIGIVQLQALPLEATKGKRSGGYAQYKYALILQGSGDTAGATKALKSYVSTYPKHEMYGQARSLLGEMGGVVGDVAGTAIGVMLPLTGKYSVYGDSVLHGIECAAGIYDPCVGPSGIKLVVRDSAAPGRTVGQIVDELAAEGVIAIIGPLLSKEAPEAAARAQAAGIPMIMLSQQASASATGDYIFRNYISPSSEIDTLVDFVFGKRKLKRFFVLYPDSKKGIEYKDLFIAAVSKWGGKIVGKYGYAPNQMEFGGELRGRGAQENMAGLVGEAGYDAIFIPDSFRYVGYLVPTLALMGVEKAQYLGISRWDDRALVERAGEYVEGALFPESFFKGSREEHVMNFNSQFLRAFGLEPTLLEALGYDSMRMVLFAVQDRGASKRDGVRGALASLVNFPGVTGRISFDERRDSKRSLSVLTVKSGAIQQAEN